MRRAVEGVSVTMLVNNQSKVFRFGKRAFWPWEVRYHANPSGELTHGHFTMCGAQVCPMFRTRYHARHNVTCGKCQDALWKSGRAVEGKL